jgi:FkbH-like protein
MTEGSRPERLTEQLSERGRVKCVVWDLDGTIWRGVLLEDRAVVLNGDVVDLIRSLDQRGILHSIASRNDPDAAIAQLARFGIADYFLCPQIHWLPKSESVREVARRLNIGSRGIAFVDDDVFELQEVCSALPDVVCVDSARIVDIVQKSRAFAPRFITDESQHRRHMYLTDFRRDEVENAHTGTREDFLQSLEMELTISEAAEEDLQRAEELTIRTSQLNTTGRVFSYEELDALRRSQDHLVLVASLRDRFGSYGKIGLALIAVRPELWMIQLLLMSCRVMSRGVGAVLLHRIMDMARDRDVRLQAEFVDTGRNRVMYITYRFAGFREVGSDGEVLTLEADLHRPHVAAPYVAVTSTV